MSAAALRSAAELHIDGRSTVASAVAADADSDDIFRELRGDWACFGKIVL